MTCAEEDTPLLGEEGRGYFWTNSAEEERSRPSWWKTARQIAHENVEGTIDSPLEYTILALIFANVVLLAVSTLPVNNKCFGSKCLRYGDKYDAYFEVAETISVLIFTLEYILRIWACVEFPDVSAKGPFWGRVRYALTFFPIVDILSIAPWWGALMLGKESPDFTTAVRVFRLIRLLKADKYLNAFRYDKADGAFVFSERSFFDVALVLSFHTNLLILSPSFCRLYFLGLISR